MEDFYKNVERGYRNIDTAIQRIFDHFSVIPEEFEGLKKLEEEIKHFKNIKVYLKDVSEIQNKIEAVRQFKDPSILERDLKEKYKRGEITLEQYTEGVKESARMVREERVEYQGKQLRIKYIANHYYLPLILSDDEKIDYIKHIIKTSSEVKFINDLENYLSKSDNKFKEFDWWLFSKLDESLDEIYIPYYNPNVNKISRFYPDFIFWFKKGDNYFIVFVDPKGTEHTDAYRRIDGYKVLFEENGKEKVFTHNGFKVRIKLFLKPEDISNTLSEYKRYWFDNIEKMLEAIMK